MSMITIHKFMRWSLEDFVYGASDGLVSMFAVVADQL
jgi:hypothetical protein